MLGSGGGVYCIMYIAVQAQHCKEPEGVYDQLVAPELPAVCGAW